MPLQQLEPGKPYMFTEIFDLKVPADELAQFFGYSLRKAKRQVLDHGMTQLVAEMIALDQWERTPEQPVLLGAVTTGKVWEFALLERETKLVTQGLESFRVPEDVEPLMRILVQALS